jgi:HAD superfamily hydrolase (TIGR01509 family)
MPALLLGSISTVADTSELQRQAFNEAFARHGLDWQWDRETYRSLLASNGGEQRIAEHARSRGEEVDAGAVHRTKSQIFQEHLAGADLPARPGVAETIQAAKNGGFKVGLVTTTSRANIDALLQAVGGSVSAGDFDVITDVSSVGRPKPDRGVYDLAVERLGERAGSCLAVEDNPGGVSAAGAAGVACVAFPNDNTAQLDFAGARERVEQLRFDDLRRLTAG